MVKDVRTMTGFLRRVDEERWEAVYEADGAAPRQTQRLTRGCRMARSLVPHDSPRLPRWNAALSPRITSARVGENASASHAAPLLIHDIYLSEKRHLLLITLVPSQARNVPLFDRGLLQVPFRFVI
jgi:hypothetical protein